MGDSALRAIVGKVRLPLAYCLDLAVYLSRNPQRSSAYPALKCIAQMKKPSPDLLENPGQLAHFISKKATSSTIFETVKSNYMSAQDCMNLHFYTELPGSLQELWAIAQQLSSNYTAKMGFDTFPLWAFIPEPRPTVWDYLTSDD